MDGIYETVVAHTLRQKEHRYSADPTRAAVEVVNDLMTMKKFVWGGRSPGGWGVSYQCTQLGHDGESRKGGSSGGHNAPDYGGYSYVATDYGDQLKREAQDRLLDLERVFIEAFGDLPAFEVQVWTALRLPIREVVSQWGEKSWETHTLKSLRRALGGRPAAETLRLIGKRLDGELHRVLTQRGEVKTCATPTPESPGQSDGNDES